MNVIYLDSLFGLNLLADYLLCLSAGRICGLRLKRGRYALAALLGALYAVAVLLPGLRFLAKPGYKLLSGAGMAWLAFGGEAHPLRCIAVFFAVSAAYGGALWAIGGRLSAGLLLLSFLSFYGLFLLLFRTRDRLRQQKKRVRLRFLGREAVFSALPDSGNGLRDPLGGAPVMVASPQALRPVFLELGGLFSQLSPVELLELSQAYPQLKGRLRLIPYSSLGGEGLLPVFRPELLEIDGKPAGELLVGVSPAVQGEDFDAII